MSYRDLRAEVRSRGLLERSGRKYLPLAGLILAMFLTSVGILAVAPWPGYLIAAPLLSMFWVQVGFIGHDSGHNQIFPSTAHNRRLGRWCMAFLLGMSFRNWVIKHNLHHAETNLVESDPDLQHPLLAFTPEAARERRGIAARVVRYQAYIYPVLALFATIGFRLDAWGYVLKRQDGARPASNQPESRGVELFMLVGNVFLTLVLPTLVLGPQRWLPVLIIGQLLLGLQMGFVFAPNHKGMETFTRESRPSFLEQQVLTSRNVYGGPLVDFFYGGLNYQVEHHLFPTMPRSSLGAAGQLVKQYCAENRIPYTEENFPSALRAIFQALDDIGAGRARSDGTYSIV